MGWFSRKKGDPDPQEARQDPVAPPPDGGDRERAVHQAVDGYWDRLGRSDSDVITYLMNPMFMGSPAWPNTRQAYRIVRTPSTVILASDGLADPDPEKPSAGAGFGCEVYIESPLLVGASFEDLRSSWIFSAIELFAQNVAAMEGISAHLERYGVASMELPMEGTDVPAELLTERGTVGALIGMPVDGRPSSLTTPVGPIDFVPLTVGTPAELADILASGQAGRDQVVADRQASGRGHLTLAP